MSNLSDSLLGRQIAREEAKARQKYGTDIVIAGRTGSRTFRAKSRSLQKSEREYIPDGPHNAAASDLRVFEVTPADFPVAPAVGSILLWHGVSYTILMAVPGDDEVGGVVVTLRLIAYRTPQNGQNPAEDRQLAKWPRPPA